MTTVERLECDLCGCQFDLIESVVGIDVRVSSPFNTMVLGDASLSPRHICKKCVRAFSMQLNNGMFASALLESK